MMIAENRRELVRFLEDRMRRTHYRGAKQGQSERLSVPIKTYLIEARGTVTANEARVVGLADQLRQIAADRILRKRLSAEVHASEEPDLATLCGHYNGRQAVSLYVDRVGPRCWLLHTAATSAAADWIVGRLAKAGSGIAQACIPEEMLEKLADLGSFRGLALDHDRRFHLNRESDAEGAPARFTKMQLRGMHARQLLALMRREDAFRHSTTLSRIQVRFQPDHDDKTVFCLEDIRYDGKITTRGTSFAAHLTVVDTLKTAYCREIEKLDSHYAIGADAESGVLSGRSLAIHTGRPIRDLMTFSLMVFSASAPFRLWGVPVTVSKDCVRVRAVDLNMGGRLDFEVMPEFIRIFLPSGTSGNTVVRFYTHMQHHFDSRVRLLGKDEHSFFQF